MEEPEEDNKRGKMVRIKEIHEIPAWNRKNIDLSLFELNTEIRKNNEHVNDFMILLDHEIQTISNYVLLRCEKEYTKNVVFNHGKQNDIVGFISDIGTEKEKFIIYNIGGTIGKGSEGSVRYAQKISDVNTRKNIIAVKERDAYTKNAVTSCINEYKIIKNLGLLHDYCKIDKKHFIFLPYYPSIPASALKKDWHEDIRAGVSTGCIESVMNLYHYGIWHNDIKPENFLVVFENPWISVKLIDYGTSILIGEKEIKENRTLGTPAYLAPECFDKNQPFYREKAEIYSLCITIFDILSMYSWSEYQNKKNRFDGYHFADIQKCCPDVFLDHDHLEKIKYNNRWLYHLLSFCYWIYKENPNDRPNFSDVEIIVNRIKAMQESAISLTFPSIKYGKDNKIKENISPRTKKSPRHMKHGFKKNKKVHSEEQSVDSLYNNEYNQGKKYIFYGSL
jgi:serine/threonine protein kinase